MPVSPPSLDEDRRRLAAALVLYLGLVIVVVTLVPFDFTRPAGFRLVGFRGLADLFANVLFFVPLGFFVAFGGRGRPVVVAFAVSLSVELLQQLLPGRAPSLIDVATNTAGGWLGGVIETTLAGALERNRRGGVFALDLPLMGLVYLAVPLLWLSGLAASGEPGREWLALLVIVAGLPVWSAVTRHHLAPRGSTGWTGPALAAGWTIVGLGPGWFGRPGFVAAAALLAGVAVRLLADLLRWREREGSRYELLTVRRVMLPLVAYLVLVAVWPMEQLGATWRWPLALATLPGGSGQTAILRLLELTAATTVLGYLVAEWGGRANRGAAADRKLGALLALGAGIGLVALRGCFRSLPVTPLELVLVMAAPIFGAVLYWRQRSFVKAIVAARSAPTPLSAPPAPRSGGTARLPVPMAAPTPRRSGHSLRR
ncbi:MAG: VanZ family protein [Gemmatimonadales bacterium]